MAKTTTTPAALMTGSFAPAGETSRTTIRRNAASGVLNGSHNLGELHEQIAACRARWHCIRALAGCPVWQHDGPRRPRSAAADPVILLATSLWPAQERARQYHP